MANPAANETAHAARQMLDGELDLVEGCRKLAQLHHRSRAPDSDAILTVIGFASETDDLPIGAERERWAIDALKEKDRQRNEYMAQANGPLTEALLLHV